MAQQIKREGTSCLSEKERRCHSVLETHVFSMSSAECYGTLFPTYSTTSCPLCIPLATEEWTAVLFTQWSFTYDEVFTPAVFLYRYAHIAKLNTHTHTQVLFWCAKWDEEKKNERRVLSVHNILSQQVAHTTAIPSALCRHKLHMTVRVYIRISRQLLYFSRKSLLVEIQWVSFSIS